MPILSAINIFRFSRYTDFFLSGTVTLRHLINEN